MLRMVTFSAILLLTACIGSSRQAELRYRVSYTVDDNGVRRSAHGVWSDTIRRAAVPLTEQFEGEFHGEAIPIELPERGVLLLTPLGSDQMGGIYASTMVRQMYYDRVTVDRSDLVSAKAQIATFVGLSRPVRCKRYSIPEPELEPNELAAEHCLDFAFIADPNVEATYRRIAVKDGSFDGLSGVRLREVRVTITRDPVTTGRLDRILPWLSAAQRYWRGRLIHQTGRVSHAIDVMSLRS